MNLPPVSSALPTLNHNTQIYANPPPTLKHTQHEKKKIPHPMSKPCAPKFKPFGTSLPSKQRKTEEIHTLPLSRYNWRNLGKPSNKCQCTNNKIAHTFLPMHTKNFRITPVNITIKTAWKLLCDYKGDDTSAFPQLPSQMRTNICPRFSPLRRISIQKPASRITQLSITQNGFILQILQKEG